MIVFHTGDNAATFCIMSLLVRPSSFLLFVGIFFLVLECYFYNYFLIEFFVFQFLVSYTMSAKTDSNTGSGGKWVSRRVQNQQCQSRKEEEPPASKPQEPKEAVEVAPNSGFERQEASDTLSNFAHYSNPLHQYKPLDSSPLQPAPNADTFNDRFIEKVNKIG